MSISRRILESAQSGLSKLTSLVIVDDEPLSTVESAALAAELNVRKIARERTNRPALDNPLARQALATPAARAARELAARDRASRAHRERDAREARQRTAADDAFRKIKDQAARGGGGSSSTGSARSADPGTPRKTRAGRTDAQMLDWYRVLDLEVGADLPQIKTAYRKMMRKYHPDMHAGNPTRLKAATELSVRVSAAYNGLIAHLDNK